MEENNGSQVINDNSSKKFNVVGIVSFVFSLVGILVAGLPCGIIATITGIIGLVTFKADKEKGRWMPVAGLVIGIVEIIVMTLYIIGNVSNLIS